VSRVLKVFREFRGQ